MMQRGWQQSRQHNRRLPQQSKIPGVPDLEFLFTEAMNSRGQSVELPFTCGEPRKSFCLVVQTGRRDSDQELTWTLHRGETSGGSAEWSYESKDLLMIHGLILLVLSDGGVPAPAKASGSASALPASPTSEGQLTAASQKTAPEDYIKYLDEAGVKLESCLIRNHPSLSEQEFEKMVARGIPGELKRQKQFYQAVDGKSVLSEIIEKLSLSEVEWVPVMFNMLSCGLLTFETGNKEVQAAGPEATSPPSAVGAASVLAALVKPETGLYTHAAFLYFVEQERGRFESFGRPFSVIIFKLGARTAQSGKKVVELLPTPVLKAVLQRLTRMKRKADLLAHYEGADYALLLPETDERACRGFASRLTEFLFSIPSTKEFDSSLVTVTIGVASLPADTQDTSMLLAMARSNGNRGERAAKDNPE